MPQKEWFSIVQPDGNWLNYGYVPETGLYHWEQNPEYCGYTATEMLAKGAV
jgi:hypothetical protein